MAKNIKFNAKPLKTKTISQKLKQKIRAKKYAAKYISTGGNQTQAMKAVSPHLTQYSAETEGHRMLQKPQVRKEIMELFEKQQLKTDDVVRTHKRNLLQNKQLGVSQSAVNDYYELIGLKRKQDDNRQQINIIVNTD